VALLVPGPVVGPEDLPEAEAFGLLHRGSGGAATLRVDMETEPWEVELPQDGFALPELEQRLVEEALSRHDGKKSAAARFLGVPRHVLLYRIEKYGIDAD
jgi:DNA-binding NtrC family response regulator